MRILIISHYFPPLNSIASQRAYSFAKYLNKLGNEIIVITTKKNLDKVTNENENFKVIEIPFLGFKSINLLKKSIKIENKNKNKNLRNIFYFIIKRVILKLINKHGIFAAERIPERIQFWIKPAVKTIIKEHEIDNIDIMISTYAPPSAHIIAYKIKKLYPKILWIADYRDLWTENHTFKGLFPFTILENFLEKKINKKADIITTVSEPLSNILRTKYKIINKVFTIENGFDPEELNNISKEFYWKDNKFHISYLGTLYKNRRDPTYLFEAIKYILNNNLSNIDNLEINFFGPESEFLLSLISKYNLGDYVKYMGFISREDSLRIQRDSNILLFLETDQGEKNEGVFTGKLFEYLFSGTFILGIGITNKSMVGKLIEDSGCGKVFGKDINSLVKFLIDVLNKNIELKVNPNYDLLNYYTRENQVRKLNELINKFLIEKK